MKRLNKVNKEWSPELAYAIGLIATDGNLSSDQRHIYMTSKDEEMILNFKKCLKLDNKIGKKARGGSIDKKYFVLQFGDKNFYDFLLGIGLTPAKSKTLGILNIPQVYFADFLRGCIDGDGNIGAYIHPESKHPQLRVRLYSASRKFLEWIKAEVERAIGIATGWIEVKDNAMSVLVYAKTDSLKILQFMYYPGHRYRLGRKYKVAKKFLGE